MALPPKPTLDDFRREAFEIAQMAKEVQNADQPWTEAQWRKISKAIEKIEAKALRPTT